MPLVWEVLFTFVYGFMFYYYALLVVRAGGGEGGWVGDGVGGLVRRIFVQLFLPFSQLFGSWFKLFGPWFCNWKAHTCVRYRPNKFLDDVQIWVFGWDFCLHSIFILTRLTRFYHFQDRFNVSLELFGNSLGIVFWPWKAHFLLYL